MINNSKTTLKDVSKVKNFKGQNNTNGFEKGVSGNPKGRPPKTITAIMRELGEGTLLDCKMRMMFKGEIITKSIDFESLENKRKYVATINEIVASTVIKQAIAGDVASQKILIEAQNPIAAKEDGVESIQPPSVTYTPVDMSK